MKKYNTPSINAQCRSIPIKTQALIQNTCQFLLINIGIKNTILIDQHFAFIEGVLKLYTFIKSMP